MTLALLLVIACDVARAPSPPPQPPASPSPSHPEPGAPAERFEGTVGIVEVVREGEIAVLTDVRTGRHESFDRVVFEFAGGVPGYHLEYVDKPVRKCGSGDPTAIAGGGWLEVRMSPADAHTEAGAPTIADRERHLDLPNLKELELTCDFEAVVTWVLGLGSPNPYRVLELSDPPRLVVDVRSE